MYLMPLKCMLKMGKMINFILCIVYHNKKKFGINLIDADNNENIVVISGKISGSNWEWNRNLWDAENVLYLDLDVYINAKNNKKCSELYT